VSTAFGAPLTPVGELTAILDCKSPVAEKNRSSLISA
jgi:hypothetical protein